MTNMGHLLVFEGPDGAGKSTLAAACGEHFRRLGKTVTVLAFPGRERGTLGELVYSLHHDARKFGIGQITPESLQALHIAAHLDAIDRAILPRLERGELLILDRFWWSTCVYGQLSGARKSTLDALLNTEREHWRGTKPSAVFLLTRNESLDSKESGELWTKRASLYAELALREASSYPVWTIRNEGSVAEAVDQVVSLSALGY